MSDVQESVVHQLPPAAVANASSRLFERVQSIVAQLETKHRRAGLHVLQYGYDLAYVSEIHGRPPTSM